MHHDAHLADGRAIVATTWADLPDDVPDLAAALDACAGLATVNVEIKNWPGDVDFDESLAVADAVVEALADPARHRACGRAGVVASTCRPSTACATGARRRHRVARDRSRHRAGRRFGDRERW